MSEESPNEKSKVEKELDRIDTFNRISKFQKAIESSDMLATKKAEFIERIAAVNSALFDNVSTPEEALKRAKEIATSYDIVFKV